MHRDQKTGQSRRAKTGNKLLENVGKAQLFGNNNESKLHARIN
jgi:hypothetical protein